MSIETVKTVAWTHDDFGVIELSRVQRVGWHPLVLRSDLEAAEARAEQLEKELGECSGGYQTLEKEVAAERARAQRAEQALRELVAVKALKWEFEGLALGGFRAEVASGAIQYEPKHARYTALKAEYDRRQPLAWAAARAIVDGEQT